MKILIATYSWSGRTARLADQIADRLPDADWSPVNKIDNLNRDFFVLCHD